MQNWNSFTAGTLYFWYSSVEELYVETIDPAQAESAAPLRIALFRDANNNSQSEVCTQWKWVIIAGHATLENRDDFKEIFTMYAHFTQCVYASIAEPIILSESTSVEQAHALQQFVA